MSGLLRLANDFIERMMNAAYGPLVNDDYAMQLGELLGDPADAELLATEAQRLNRVDELSPHTWLWLVSLPEAQDRLSRELLVELCLQFDSAAYRSTVIDCITRGRPRLAPGQSVVFDTPSLDEIEDPQLADLVRATVGMQHREELQSVAEVARDYRNAESMLVALLTVNRRVSHQAASVLLHHDWPGQPGLLDFFESRISTMDPESRAQWGRLGPGR